MVGGIPIRHSEREWEGCHCRENGPCHISSEGGVCGGWNPPSVTRNASGRVAVAVKTPPPHISSERGVCGGWNSPPSLETRVGGSYRGLVVQYIRK